MKGLDEIFKSVEQLTDTVISRDPFMVRSLKFKRELDIALAPYYEIRNDLIKKRKQTNITSFFTSPAPPKTSSSTSILMPSTSGYVAPKPATSGTSSAKPSSIAAFFRPRPSPTTSEDGSDQEEFTGFELA